MKDSSRETLFQLGCSFLRTWVRLNMAGYGLQVMATPSLHVYQYENGLIPEDYPESSVRVFAQGRQALGKGFGILGGEIPAWMFRTGKSPALPEEIRTLRLQAQ